VVTLGGLVRLAGLDRRSLRIAARPPVVDSTLAPMVDIEALVDGVRAGRRADVSRAITLVESSRADHRSLARELLTELTDATGGAVRVGISGVPGVGKSTFIESLGMHLSGDGKRVGVLAVDPSSVRTGGSVLGDKTRMARLAVDPNAFIRPSPSAGTLGGVARATSQALAILEAAAYDVVLVETVGVGQSEVTVAGMVDTFLFLTLARTGDQLQGIKKGILEIADVIAVNKADGDREQEARVAARELAGALRLVGGHGDWAPR
jgi:LAO/AO transport system kinase